MDHAIQQYVVNGTRMKQNPVNKAQEDGDGFFVVTRKSTRRGARLNVVMEHDGKKDHEWQGYATSTARSPNQQQF